ncbi:MAG TPA: hypothetical protein VD995_20030 [Azospirillum sp.]|nr:hypothetical protein [Azospirillum sp.]
MTGAQAIHHELAAVAAALDEARAQAESGATIDLAGLDARVAALCGAVQALPRDAGQGLLNDLESLLGAVNALAATLAHQREAVLTAPHTARQRAAAAYGRTPPPHAEPPAEPPPDEEP